MVNALIVNYQQTSIQFICLSYNFNLEISHVLMYYVNSADVSSFLLFLPHTCRISADRKRSSWVKGKFTLKKQKQNRNQDVLFFSSDCNKQQLYADTHGCGGR